MLSLQQEEGDDGKKKGKKKKWEKEQARAAVAAAGANPEQDADGGDGGGKKKKDKEKKKKKKQQLEYVGLLARSFISVSVSVPVYGGAAGIGLSSFLHSFTHATQGARDGAQRLLADGRDCRRTQRAFAADLLRARPRRWRFGRRRRRHRRCRRCRRWGCCWRLLAVVLVGARARGVGRAGGGRTRGLGPRR